MNFFSDRNENTQENIQSTSLQLVSATDVELNG